RLAWRGGIVLAAGAVGALGYAPLGRALFGTMDDEWLGIVRKAATYNFPGSWTPGDWMNLSMSIVLAAVGGIAMRAEHPGAARLLGGAAGLAVVGVVAMIVAGLVPYRLLLQGQPYRVLWILQVLEAPLAFWLAARLWSDDVLWRVVA